MLHSLRLALSGQGAKQGLDREFDGHSASTYDAPDVECPSNNGLVNRSSSRSSSPVNSSSAEAYRAPLSPRITEKLLQHGTSRSTPSTLPSYAPGKQAASRGRHKHLILLLVLLLPAVTGLAVMCIRLRSSEAEHALVLPPSSTVWSWTTTEGDRRSGTNLVFAEDDEDTMGMQPQSYAQMRYRNRDRMPKWMKKWVAAVKGFFAKDPVGTYLLRDGPMTWYWNWLTKGRWWPAPLWDKHALVPKAPFLWGSPDQLCSIVNASATVALVGNGPLTPEQRQEINAAGSVLRINAMNNRLPGDKIDVWLVRYNGLGPANFWGFKQLSYRESEEVVGASQGVVFLGGHPTKLMAYAVEELLTWYPFMPVEKSMQINITGYWDLYNRVLSDKTTLLKAGAMPSSGLLAALTAVPCMRLSQKLHVYGFNWNPQAWFMHKMSSEQKIIKRLFQGLDVTIHPTACDGMYTCHKLCDGVFYRVAKDGDKAVCEAKALEDKKVKAQQALARKQKRNAAMQAMLAKPGYQGALLESVVEIDKEDPGWVLDGAIRPKKKGSKVETGAWNTIGVQSIPLTEVRQSIKYSKSDRVPGIVSKPDGYMYNEQGTRLGREEDIGTGAEDVLQAAALEELAEAAEEKAAQEFKQRTEAGAGASDTKPVVEQAEDVGQDATLEEGAEETEELQEVAAEAEAEAEVEDQEEDTAEAGEEDAEEDLPLTKEASHPKSAQEALLAAKLSAADAAAQAAVDDMLAEQALDGEDVESKEAEEGGGIAEDLEDSFIEEEDADDAESDSARRLL